MSKYLELSKNNVTVSFFSSIISLVYCDSLSHKHANNAHKSFYPWAQTNTKPFSLSTSPILFTSVHAHTHTNTQCTSHCISESVWVVVSPIGLWWQWVKETGTCTHTQPQMDVLYMHQVTESAAETYTHSYTLYAENIDGTSSDDNDITLTTRRKNKMTTTTMTIKIWQCVNVLDGSTANLNVPEDCDSDWAPWSQSVNWYQFPVGLWKFNRCSDPIANSVMGNFTSNQRIWLYS